MSLLPLFFQSDVSFSTILIKKFLCVTFFVRKKEGKAGRQKGRQAGRKAGRKAGGREGRKKNRKTKKGKKLI